MPNPYDKIAARYAGARKPWLEQRYLPALIERLTPGELVLDLGCGTGRPIAEYLAGAQMRVLYAGGRAGPCRSVQAGSGY